jgi:hypothetical protein
MNDVLDVSVANVTTTDVLAKHNGMSHFLSGFERLDNPEIAMKLVLWTVYSV